MKALLTIILSLTCLTSMAQQNVIYVVFTHNVGTSRIRHLSSDGKYDTLKFRCENHFFRTVNRDVGFYSMYAYINPINLPDNPILTKPLSFLDEVEYIEWEEHTENFTLQEYRDFLEQLETYDKVYFIDRAEIKDGMMKLYPVKEFKSEY